ncbi:MAG: hypothetical protein U5J82_03805 [Desulfobacterales bacterium]|nr:hypothetical protein [Desulfobacterales bacterium]
MMLTVVASICLLVQVYSLGYMAGDPGSRATTAACPSSLAP